MIIISPSVKHCGHHFVRYRLLLDENFRGHPPHHMLPYDDYSYCLYGHFEHNNLNEFNTLWNTYGRMVPSVIPLRHPARVLESYRCRKTVNSRDGEFFQEWKYMMEMVPYFKEVYFLHLDDLDRRVEQASTILHTFNIVHPVDWSVDKESGSKHDTHNLELTDDILKDIPQSFIDFYEDTKIWKP